MKKLNSTARLEPLKRPAFLRKNSRQLQSVDRRQHARMIPNSRPRENASLEKAEVQEFQKNLVIPNKLVGPRCSGVSPKLILEN